MPRFWLYRAAILAISSGGLGWATLRFWLFRIVIQDRSRCDSGSFAL